MTFGLGSKSGTDVARRYGETSEIPHFSTQKRQENGLQGKTTAAAKYYGFRRRSIFSTEGAFGKALNFKNEKAAQRVSFGAGYPVDIHADILADVWGQKLLQILKNKQAFGRGRP